MFFPKPFLDDFVFAEFFHEVVDAGDYEGEGYDAAYGIGQYDASTYVGGWIEVPEADGEDCDVAEVQLLKLGISSEKRDVDIVLLTASAKSQPSSPASVSMREKIPAPPASQMKNTMVWRISVRWESVSAKVSG